MKLEVLIVEDSPQDLEILRECIISLGHKVVVAQRLSEAQKRLEAPNSIDLIVTDIRLPDGTGISLLDLQASTRPVIFTTAYGDVEEAVTAMARGAFHYLTKPVRTDELQVLLDRAHNAIETNRELTRLRDLHGREEAADNLLVRSPRMREVLETVRAAAESDSTVLFQGESGTGKEVFAQALHRFSPRAGRPFIAVNCGAIPATLLEADLFGHEKGAFTGATARRIGKFERAQRGTLFLDEIGTLPLDLQTRLLRAIQEREIERVGGSGPIAVDFRLLAATNRDLAKAVEAGTFRDDLYYRLKVISIKLPPLRERREEIPALAAHFLSRRVKNIENLPRIDESVMACFTSYDWPGNIRELENAIEHAVVLSRGGAIQLHHLPEELRGRKSGATPAAAPPAEDAFGSLEDAKRRHIEEALRRCGGRREEAARLLGIHRNTLRGLITRYGLATRNESGA